MGSSRMSHLNMNAIKKRLKNAALYLFIAVFIAAATPFGHSANAIETGKCDTEFYQKNDILYYSPCASACEASTGVSGVGAVSSLRGSNNGDKIVNFWQDAGLSVQQASGVTGSMQHEGSFSPFIQEFEYPWPTYGWGIAQFSFDQRNAVIEYSKKAFGEALFNQYYSEQYSGRVSQSNGFVPEGVPVPVNDQFLLAQLNYLLGYIKDFKPASIPDRVNFLKRDFGQTVDPDMSLFDYLKTQTQPDAVAIAWTYLYEYPGDIKETAQMRADSAKQIMDMNGAGSGTTTSCGGSLSTGGMTLDQAKDFMEKQYKGNVEDSRKYLGGAGQDCPGGPLANCVSFSTWFINKYTSLKGFDSGAPGNGGTVVSNIVARNPDIKSGHSPRPYSIFSTYESGSTFGHTGVVLGVDTQKGKVIIGEAGCGDNLGMDWITAREYDLSTWDSDKYTYAYTDGVLKGI